MSADCIGQVILNVIQRCNESSSVCSKLHIDTHDVRFTDTIGITVTFRGHYVGYPHLSFRLGLHINPIQGNHIPEDMLFEEVLHELERLISDQTVT